MQGKKTGKDKRKIDMVAACVILQSYLDNMKKE
jgi:RNase H-fold protein (predicted Holliday junction resolvase)